MEHAFVIPAYRESPYLETCLRSLVEQDSPTTIVVTTSTPNRHIEATARRFDLPLLVHDHAPSIAADWNAALTATPAAAVTIAHQDDVYHRSYVGQMRQALSRHPDATLAFTGFAEYDEHGLRPGNLNLRIKRALTRRAFGDSEAITGRTAKRRLLALGNPICCPSVTFRRSVRPDFRFGERLRSNLDWEAWAQLAEAPGAFVHLRDILVWHRVHGDSETTATIGGRIRDVEDLEMLQRFWPAWIARPLASVYRLSYRANRT